MNEIAAVSAAGKSSRPTRWLSLLLRRGGLYFVTALVVMALALPCFAQYVAPYVNVQGTLTNSSGLPAQNATLTFQPNTIFFVAGTSTIVTASQCATDSNGSVVGVGNPVSGPRVSPQFSGLLPAGNYYVEFTWYDQLGNQTLPSPEVAVQLTATGELQILPPVGNGPAQAVGMNVYIGTTSGGETYQGHTTALTAQYTQASALTTGAAVPVRNNTPCRVIANDAAWPTGTGYNVSLVDASGNTLFAYPQMWQFLGPGSAYNLSQGIPYYNGMVTYPVPVLTQPTNHNMQAINGPLSMGTPGGNEYNIVNVNELGVGTMFPAWGVDVEGSALAGAVNAKTGYLVNGTAGTSGQCLASDGSYFDTPVNCVEALPTLYYQTMQSNGGDLAQEAKLNFDSTLNASSSAGVTNVGLPTKVTAGSCTNCSVNYDAQGRVTGTSNGNPLPLIEEQEIAGCTISAGGSYTTCSVSLTWSPAFADNTYIASCTGLNPTSTGGETQPTLAGIQKTGTGTGLSVIIQTQGTSYPQGYGLVDCVAVCKVGGTCQ